MKHSLFLFMLCLSTQSYSMQYVKSAVGYTHSYYNQQLIKAAAENDTALITHALKNGADCNTKDQDSHTPLYIAVHNGNTEAVQALLLSPGIDLSLRLKYDQNNFDIFTLALQQDNLAILEQFIKIASTDFNHSYTTPSLNDAVSTGNTAKVALFLKHGALVNPYAHTRLKRLSPLHIAAQYGYIDMCKLLLQAGADKNDRNNLGLTPLMVSVINNQKTTAQLLLEAGTNPQLKDSLGHTALDLAQRNHPELVDTVFRPYFKKLKQQLMSRILTQTNPQKQAPNNYISALPKPLIEAIALHASDTSLEKLLFYDYTLPLETYAENVKRALKAGAQVDAKNKWGATALHHAARLGLNETVKLLLEYGADINSLDPARSTPLVTSIYYNQASTARLLLEAGADLKVNSGLGTALDIAARDYPELVNTVFKPYFKKVRQQLISKVLTRANPQEQAPNNYISKLPKPAIEAIALHASDTSLEKLLCYNETIPSKEIYAENVQKALKAGAQVDVRNNKYFDNKTALHTAAGFGLNETVKLLLDYGANINSKDRQGSTPLMNAFINGNLETLKLLLEHGAQVNVQNVNSNSILHSEYNLIAQRHPEYSAMIEALIHAGLDLYSVNNQGMTAFYMLKIDYIMGRGTIFYKKNRRLIKSFLKDKKRAALEKLLATAQPNDTAQPAPLCSMPKPLFYAIAQHASSTYLENQLFRAIVSTSDSKQEIEAPERAKELVTMQQALAAGACVDYTYNPYLYPTALAKAISSNNASAVKLLLAYGANIHKVFTSTVHDFNTLDNLPPSNSAVLGLLLEAGLNPDTCNDSGRTLLHRAAEFGNLKATQMLLKYGATVDARNAFGYTPLYRADYSNTQLLQLLLEAGANPLEGLVYGNLTPAHQAQNYKSSKQLFKFWIAKRRAFILSKILTQVTADSNSLLNQLPAEIIDSIITHAADTSLEKSLKKAIAKSDVKAAYKALAAGADPNFNPSVFCDGSSFLHYAVNSNNVELIELLIAYGAEVNIQDLNGETPLHYAADRGSNECMLSLLSHGANPCIKDNNGTTATKGNSMLKLLYYHFNSHLKKQH